MNEDEIAAYGRSKLLIDRKLVEQALEALKFALTPLASNSIHIKEDRFELSAAYNKCSSVRTALLTALAEQPSVDPDFPFGDEVFIKDKPSVETKVDWQASAIDLMNSLRVVRGALRAKELVLSEKDERIAELDLFYGKAIASKEALEAEVTTQAEQIAKLKEVLSKHGHV